MKLKKLAWYKGNNKSMRKIMAIRDLQNFMIEITDSPDIKQWSDFVYNHEYGNIFQTPEMTEGSKRTKNYEPVSLAVVDKKR